ncbi:hypothetical protein HA402_012790 [Bradysia odoriphaga]|nr:hypothetical protein HA402_012790 [Bradysia odoriphaga]
MKYFLVFACVSLLCLGSVFGAPSPTLELLVPGLAQAELTAIQTVATAKATAFQNAITAKQTFLTNLLSGAGLGR